MAWQLVQWKEIEKDLAPTMPAVNFTDEEIQAISIALAQLLNATPLPLVGPSKTAYDKLQPIFGAITMPSS